MYCNGFRHHQKYRDCWEWKYHRWSSEVSYLLGDERHWQRVSLGNSCCEATSFVTLACVY